MLPGGALLAHLIDQIPKVREHQASKMLDQVLEFVGSNPTEILERVRRDDRLSRLLWNAARAVADSNLEAKIRGLAGAAGAGIREDAAIDESQLIVRTLAQMENLHVRALAVLQKAPNQGEETTNVPLEELLGVEKAIAEAIAEDLKRLALAETAGMSFRGLATGLWLAPYGQRILAFLDTYSDAAPEG